MARRSSKPTSTDPQPTEEGTVSTTTEAEAPVETPAAEAPVETPAETPEAEIDLSAFQSAATKAVEARDTSTGEVAEAEFSDVNVQYRALDGAKAKSAAKNWLTDQLTEAMNSLDVQKARAFMLVQNHLSASGPKASGTKAERQPVDPTEAFVEQVVTLNLARALLSAPEGIAEDAQAQADAKYAEVYPQAEQYLAWFTNESEDKGDEPEIPAFVKNGVKLALGRSAKAGGAKRSSGGGSPFTGERRSVEKHIAEVFDGVASGTFLSIAEIRKANTSEYGDDHPSAGAISARLFPKSGKVTLEGVTPAKQDGKNGAVKS